MQQSAADASTATPVDASLVEGLPSDRIEDAYDQRHLDRLEDAALVAAVAAVVAEPRRGPADSFVLHAPLELTARARLLDRTPSEHRRLARLRLLSIAARYQTYEASDLAGPDDAGGDPIDAGAVIEAIDRGDAIDVDARVRRLAKRHRSDQDHDPAATIATLAAAIAPRTAAAAHGPIFLATLAEAPDRALGWLPLLRPLAQALASRPSWKIGWMDRVEPTATPADPDALFLALADPPRLGSPGSTFIHPLLMQVDAPGVADDLLGPIAGPGRPTDPDSARAITRVAALAMVRDDPSHAPYGWTHALTLPQAVLTLAPAIEAGGRHPLTIAASQVLAIRTAQGRVALDPADPLVAPADPATRPAREAELVAQAARRHDAHIAKYVLASLTAAAADPGASDLHLTAAEHLLSVWDDRGPDPDDPLHPAAGPTSS